MGRLTWTSQDFDADRQSFSIPGANAANDGTDYAAWFTAGTAVDTALRDITRTSLIEVDRESTNAESALDAMTSDSQNNDEFVCEFSVVGMNGTGYKLTIKGADRSQCIARNQRLELELGSGNGAAFKTAFEAWYLYPGTLDNPGAPSAGTATLQVVYVKST